MASIVLDKRFCGPPNSANGGYVSGRVAEAVGNSCEVTLRAPPPLGRALELIAGKDGAAELRDGETLLATGRPAQPSVGEVPTATFSEAEEASRSSPYDASNHVLPGCFVCGPERASGDGLRIFVGPLPARTGRLSGLLAAAWIPSAELAGRDGRIAAEFVWAALDCPSGFAGLLGPGLTGAEPILLGRMTARVDMRPRPGDKCTIVAWPTGRDGRKVFAGSALLGPEGEMLAIAQTTWVIVDRQVLLGQR
jgi:hypothetical protein